MELIFALKSNSKLSGFTTVRPKNLDNVPRVFDELSGARDDIVGLIEQYDELGFGRIRTDCLRCSLSYPLRDVNSSCGAT